MCFGDRQIHFFFFYIQIYLYLYNFSQTLKSTSYICSCFPHILYWSGARQTDKTVTSSSSPGSRLCSVLQNSTVVQRASKKNGNNEILLWRIPDMDTVFQPRVEGVAWVESILPHWSAPVIEVWGWLGFSRFVFIFSTSKLYKNMQHTSWPKIMWF